MTTWRKEISGVMDENGETWAEVLSCTLSDSELDKDFDDGYGGTEGDAFTLWTDRRVYFPVVYDGAEWVGSVARNPDGIATRHQGGC